MSGTSLLALSLAFGGIAVNVDTYSRLTQEQELAELSFRKIGDQRFELPWIDALYGSATYLPMRDEARFEVRLTHSGVIARPANAAGKEAVSEWGISEG